MATKKETAKAVNDAKKIISENSELQLPPYEEIIVNLGFWITMAQRAGQMIVKNRLQSDGMSKSDPDKKS